jgi:hypothetical protein
MIKRLCPLGTALLILGLCYICFAALNLPTVAAEPASTSVPSKGLQIQSATGSAHLPARYRAGIRSVSGGEKSLKATTVSRHDGSLEEAGALISPTTKFRVIILKTPGYRQAIAGAACGGQWVGLGLPSGHRHFSHALLGRIGRKGVVDLNPKGFEWSMAAGTDGRLQVGGGQMPDGRGGALLWSGTAQSVVVLSPDGFKFSLAVSVRSGQEVGCGEASDGRDYAMLWRGTAGSFLNLNPKGCVSSKASATDGVHQVGFGKLPNGKTHAFLWRGSAASAVDLNPQGYASSEARGISGGEIVGDGRPKGVAGEHAILWLRSATKFVDLNPSGCHVSCANATNGRQQVGYAASRVHGMAHAMVWKGTPKSAIDLQKVLPHRYSLSEAYAITSRGMIFGLASGRGRKHVVAVEWLPVKTHPSERK